MDDALPPLPGLAGAFIGFQPPGQQQVALAVRVGLAQRLGIEPGIDQEQAHAFGGPDIAVEAAEGDADPSRDDRAPPPDAIDASVVIWLEDLLSRHDR